MICKCFNNFFNELCQMKCDIIINSAYSNDRKNPNKQIIIFHSSTMHSQKLTRRNTTTLPIYPDTFQRSKQKTKVKKLFFLWKNTKTVFRFSFFFIALLTNRHTCITILCTHCVPVKQQKHLQHTKTYKHDSLKSN